MSAEARQIAPKQVELGEEVVVTRCLAVAEVRYPERSDHSAWQAVLLHQFEQKLKGGGYKHEAKHNRAWHYVIKHLHFWKVHC